MCWWVSPGREDVTEGSRKGRFGEAGPLPEGREGWDRFV